MLNKTIWTELWNRAQREPIGVFLRFTNVRSAQNNLYRSKPPECAEYTIALTSEHDALFLLRPGVTLNDASDAHAFSEIFNDLNQEPLP